MTQKNKIIAEEAKRLEKLCGIIFTTLDTSAEFFAASLEDTCAHKQIKTILKRFNKLIILRIFQQLAAYVETFFDKSEVAEKDKFMKEVHSIYEKTFKVQNK